MLLNDQTDKICKLQNNNRFFFFLHIMMHMYRTRIIVITLSSTFSFIIP